jgi:hypothetical protein
MQRSGSSRAWTRGAAGWSGLTRTPISIPRGPRRAASPACPWRWSPGAPAAVGIPGGPARRSPKSWWCWPACRSRRTTAPGVSATNSVNARLAEVVCSPAKPWARARARCPTPCQRCPFGRAAIPGGYLRGSMSWLTVRLIMRIAGMAAAATIAGRGPFFPMPSRARVRLAKQLRLAPGSLTGCLRGSIHEPAPHQHAARAPPHDWSRPQQWAARRPLAHLSRCGSGGAEHTCC